MSAPPLLTKPEDLAELIDRIKGEPAIALDTEATGFHRYHERICLIQLSTRDRTWLVDPFVIGDLSPIGGFMADPARELVIHDADYDLRMFKRNYGFRAARVFDTFVAAELLNEPQLSLAGMLEKYFGEKLDKKFQKADWSMRPLPRPMLDYAAKDTAHLLELRGKLLQKLTERGRMEWAKEEFALLVSIPFEAEENNEPGFLKIKGAKLLKPHQLAVLRELHAWREQLAERLDRAPFMMLNNEVMIALAVDPPADPNALATRKGIGERTLAQNGRRIMEAIERGRSLPKDQWPRLERPKRHLRDPDFDARMDRLRAARGTLMKEHDLPPGVVCANQYLMEIARRLPRTPDDLRTIPGIRRYQAEVFGQVLINSL